MSRKASKCPRFSAKAIPALLPAEKPAVFGEADDAQPIVPASRCRLLFLEDVGRIVARGGVDENDVRSRVFLDLRFQRHQRQSSVNSAVR